MKKEELKKNTEQVKRDWLRAQSRMLEYQHQKVENNRVCDDMKTQAAVLLAKKLRMNAEVTQLTKEIASLRSSRKLLDTEMKKHNEALHVAKETKIRLANENFNKESDFK
jgi:chromosome segregation ATPase